MKRDSKHNVRPVVRLHRESVIERTHALLTCVARDGCLNARAMRELGSVLDDPTVARLPHTSGNPIQTDLFLLRQAIVALEYLAQDRPEDAVRVSLAALPNSHGERQGALSCGGSEIGAIDRLASALRSMCLRLMQQHARTDGEFRILDPA